MAATREDKESEPLYWMGELIHGMSLEKLKQALISANMIILNQRDELKRYRNTLDKM